MSPTPRRPTANGADSFSFRVYDGQAYSTAASVNLNVLPVNDPPEARDDRYVMTDRTSLSVPGPGVLGNDTDADGDTLQMFLHPADATGLRGTLWSWGAGGSFLFEAALDFSGETSFVYTVTDGHGGSAQGRVTIVLPNSPPVAVDDTFIAVRGQPLQITAPGVLANDSDPDGDTVRMWPVADTTGLRGALTSISANGAFVFVPEAGFVGTTSFRYTATDQRGGTAQGTVRIQIPNQSPVAVDDTYVVQEGQLLQVSADQGLLANDSDPDADTLRLRPPFVNTTGLRGQITFVGANGTFGFVPEAGFTGSTSFSYILTDGDLTDEGRATIDVRAAAFHVQGTTVTPSGVSIRFDRAIDPAVLNLYEYADLRYGPADVTLTGTTTGAVRGSLVLDADGQGMSFVKTGGALAPDPYTLTVRAGAGGLRDLSGRALDGDGNGIEGDDFSQVFTVGPSSAPVLSLPDLVRGPGQSAVLPLTLTNAGGVTRIAFDVLHDTGLLSIDGVQLANGASGSVTRSAIAGGTRIEAVFTTALGAGTVSPLTLTAGIPAAAAYQRTGVARLANVQIDRGAQGSVANSVADRSVIVAAYFMDTSGNRGYSMLDVQRLQRVVSGLDTGYAAYPMVDPVLIGDLNGNGQLTSLDVNRFMQFVQGQARPEIPALPAGSSPLTFGGPARNVGLGGSGSASAGDLVSIPLTLDNAQGIESLTAKIVYDASRLEYKGVRLATDFPYRLVKHVAGEIVLDLARLNALGSGLSELLEIDFQVKAGAAEGGAAIDLQVLTLNDGKLSQSPASQVGVDGTDAQITVVAVEPPAPVMLRSTTASVETTNLVLPVPGPETNGGVAPQVNWSVPLAQTEPTAPNPVTVTTGDDWKKTAWAKDLTQRLAQLSPAAAAQPQAQGKTGMLKTLLAALTRK
ncbi:MAG: tandem-95 repeat protein [Betaproteobacteria bacterium]|nr:tandem-95 repeat protein [Betaproteobacteria bacterium]